MGYSGSYPVSKLEIRDKKFHDVRLELYAYSTLKPRDSAASATPAIAFSLQVRNPSKQTAHVSFMFNLPLGMQPDTARVGEHKASFKMHGIHPSECAKACAADPNCMSWQVEIETKSCYLINSVPLHVWRPGYFSGQKSTWKASGSTLTHNRPGSFPQSGNTTLLLQEQGRASFMVGNDFHEIWEHFTKFGHLTSEASETGFHGSASIDTSVKPGREETLTIVLGWFYPNRDFTGTMKIWAPCP